MPYKRYYKRSIRELEKNRGEKNQNLHTDRNAKSQLTEANGCKISMVTISKRR